MHLHDRIIQAKQHAAPQPRELYGGVPIVGDATPAEAPHVVPIDNPEELRDALEFYLSLSKWATQENYDFATGQADHEAQHYEAAQLIGAAAVTHELALFKKGRGPFAKYSYQAQTITHGVVDPEALAVITGHPDRLSPEDWKYLDDAGLDLNNVGEIAARNHWPMPLGLQQGDADRTLH
jgi:hypothetical protein